MYPPSGQNPGPAGQPQPPGYPQSQPPYVPQHFGQPYPQQQGPQFSPDGRFVWNGYGWVPTGGGGSGSNWVPLAVVGAIIVGVVLIIVLLSIIGTQVSNTFVNNRVDNSGGEINNVFSNISSGLANP